MTTQYIQNQWEQGEGLPFHSVNPATGIPFWQGEEGSNEQVNRAVLAARRVFPSWARLSIEERITYIEKFRKALDERAEELAEVISQETGKVLWETRGEVKGMLGKINLSIQSFHERCPEKSQELPTSTAWTRHKPHGVVVVFSPFNFPAHLPNGHIIPAMIAGNVVILKPSPLTPKVGETMIKIWEQADLPPGVLQMIQGKVDPAKTLSIHPEIDALFFTGSSQIGGLLREQFAKQPGKILALEMGGNNPLVVHEVGSNVEAAAYHTVQSAFITTGQRCTCARRLIVVEDSNTPNFLECLLDMTRSLKIGSYNESPEPFMGPLVREEAALHFLDVQKQLEEKEAHPILRMEHLKEGTGFVSPGIIDMTTVSNRQDDEWFAPLLQVIRVASFDEAIAEANKTSYGLSAGLLSQSEKAYEEFYHRVRAGIINWNSPTTGANGTAPFGGVGKSGNFRPSAYYAADYCSYPVASVEAKILKLPKSLAKGVEVPHAKSS